MVNGRIWTKEEIIYLKSHYFAEHYEDLSKRLNRTPVAVRIKAKKLGILDKSNPKRPTEKTKQKSSDTRNRLISEGIIKPPKSKISDNDINKIKDLYEKGIKPIKIFKEIKCGYSTVSKCVKSIKDDKRKNQMDDFYNNLKKLNRYERGYIAGIIDGEGSLVINLTTHRKKGKKERRYYGVSIVIGNNDIGIINYMYNKLCLFTKKRHQLNKLGHDEYIISMYGKDMVTIFLKFIIPYIQSDKTKSRAKLMLKFCKVKTNEEREEIYKKMRIYKTGKNIKNEILE